MKKISNKRMVTFIAVIFIMVVTISALSGIKYIDNKLLTFNENVAVDIAQLVKNNFQITDKEVTYMKSLTFNEMEVDAINKRLMDVGNGVQLNTNISNVYIVAPLAEDEVKYHVDKSNEKQFRCKAGTPLNAVWLLNGNISEDGKFVVKKRADIYRYTDISGELKRGFDKKRTFGIYSSDQWGNFITGYVPIYSVEGNYVGMLGIDMDPDQYQRGVMETMIFMLIAFGIVFITSIILFLLFYYKYTKVNKSRLYFDFYSRMSHDMRTPMNGIMGMVHVAKDENDSEKLHSYFRKVGESSEYLLRLINDTLDVGKISNGKMRLLPVNAKCSELMENIVDMVQATAQKKKLSFEVYGDEPEEDCWINVDEVRFKQIFINLLSNAIKYTPEGGTVKFTKELINQKGNIMHVRFIIEDNGVGMSEKFIKKYLYSPYSQENNGITSMYDGTGLGLSITKSLVELMGGTINVQSVEGGGTTFTVELKLHMVDVSEESDSESRDSIEKYKKLKGSRILLCEDNELNAEIASQILQKKGYIVDIARNGKIGTEKFEYSSINYYNAILMDIRMPVMDGIEATKVIRSMERADAATVPIIAMTANAYAEDIENTCKAGINEHLSKPINPDLLFKALEDNILK